MTAKLIPHPMSAKRDLLASDGFLLSGNKQPEYQFNWHEHDCSMLLWVSAGSLESRWHGTQETVAANKALTGGTLISESQLTLQPGMALLLPAVTAHANRARTHQQQHGQLYLEPDLLRHCPVRGAFYLDAPARSMLATLTMPGLSPASRQQLVRALLPQLEHGHPVVFADSAETSIAQRLSQLIGAALDEGQRPPSLESMASVLGMSMRSLQRHCLQEFGCSPVQLRRHLIAQAATQMLDSGIRLAEASHQLGFSSSGHLSRLLSSVGKSS
ncbi:helix-turn-helix transcriptional regulator (plasmid) [Diaphorobacter sp. HDW4B]|uniref:AraC family transcriptional regulator n=1 Tax=Diaphorobacter sp. HDW4B TaxID=2714925 RepID=UPI00140B43DF|nr:AraC family transcriptional regulator [Diaphorobacter sp. HDW4B]QIL74270.1 helix-turn-helix transcriptional regulator [Diaphorobacter sp. HDW4B]